MTRRAALASLALATLATTAFAAAPANTFSLVNTAGKNVGKAAFSINKDKNGYHVVGNFQYKLGSSVQADTNTGSTAMGANVAFNEGEFTEDYKVSEDGSFLSGYTSNASNQMMTSFQPNKAGTSVTVNQIQGGVNVGSHDLPIPKPSFILTPDFDPACFQLLLTIATTHPHPDKLYLVLVPGGPSTRGKEATQTVSLQLATDTPSGTLDGKPVKVMHYVVTYHTGHTDLFTDEAGSLMQADMGPLNISYIRTKFALDPAK